MVYEMRFQTVDPARRAEYVKIYREAVQGCKSAGSTRRTYPVQRRRSVRGGGHFVMGEQGASGALARHRLLQILSRRGGGAANQEEPRRAYMWRRRSERLLCQCHLAVPR